MTREEEYEDEPTRRERKKRKPLMVRLLVHDLKTDETIRELTFDFNDGQKRKWVMRVELWAFFNHYSVELLTVTADELLKIAEGANGNAGPRPNFTLPNTVLPQLR